MSKYELSNEVVGTIVNALDKQKKMLEAAIGWEKVNDTHSNLRELESNLSKCWDAIMAMVPEDNI